MNIEDKENSETQVDIDLEAANAEISSELFGQDEDGEAGKEAKAGTDDTPEGESEAGEGDADAEAGASSPQDKEGDADKSGEEAPANSEEVQAVGAPQTWTKEALEKWATIDPVVQAEILKREEDMHRGIEQYKTAADIGMKYSKVVEPFAPILAAENIDPVQMFQSFAANHYLLTRGTPEQKVELAANMLNGYKIPLAELLNYIADQGELTSVDPEITALRKEIGELKNGFTARQTQEQEAVAARVAEEIEAFAKDPAHPYFDELAGDIHQLFKSGMASTLAEAYEKAVWSNPSTRQKETDRLTADSLSAAQKADAEKAKKKAKATGDQLLVDQKPRDGTVPTGSIDDTLNETLASIEARG